MASYQKESQNFWPFCDKIVIGSEIEFSENPEST